MLYVDQPNGVCFENVWHDLAESVVILFFEEEKWICWDFGNCLRNLEDMQAGSDQHSI